VDNNIISLAMELTGSFSAKPNCSPCNECDRGAQGEFAQALINASLR